MCAALDYPSLTESKFSTVLSLSANDRFSVHEIMKDCIHIGRAKIELSQVGIEILTQEVQRPVGELVH
jgi:hypothetical protein